MRIEDSGLSVRAVNALRRAGIFTLEEAQALGEDGFWLGLQPYFNSNSFAIVL